MISFTQEQYTKLTAPPKQYAKKLKQDPILRTLHFELKLYQNKLVFIPFATIKHQYEMNKDR